MVTSTPSIVTHPSGNSSTASKTGWSNIKSSITTKDVVFWLSLIATLGITIAGFTRISQIAGNREDINTLKPKIAEILSFIAASVFALIVVVIMYFAQDNIKAIYFSIVISCISLGLAYAALVVAVITR